MVQKNILNKFKQILGEYCAINQFVELAKRSFVSEHQRELNVREQFICLAEKNNIALTSYNANQMILQISLSYIVNIHLCFETYLKDTYNAGRRYGAKLFREKRQDESWLVCIIDNLFGSRIPEEKKPLIELCEYYRLIRNTAVHDLCDINTHEKEYIKVQGYDFITDSKFVRLNAPNFFQNIVFDDFIMYTRSCNELAITIYNHFEYDYQKIVQDTSIKEFKKLLKYKNNRNRGEQALYIYLKTAFKDAPNLNTQIGDLFNMVLAHSSNG